MPAEVTCPSREAQSLQRPLPTPDSRGPMDSFRQRERNQDQGRDLCLQAQGLGDGYLYQHGAEVSHGPQLLEGGREKG